MLIEPRKTKIRQQTTKSDKNDTPIPHLPPIPVHFRSGALDFEEFSALLKDMQADRAVAEKKMRAYYLPPSLLQEFSQEAIEEMRVTFAMFDESGDGALDEEELGGLLRTFGQEPTKEKVYYAEENVQGGCRCRSACLCCPRSAEWGDYMTLFRARHDLRRCRLADLVGS